MKVKVLLMPCCTFEWKATLESLAFTNESNFPLDLWHSSPTTRWDWWGKHDNCHPHCKSSKKLWFSLSRVEYDCWIDMILFTLMYFFAIFAVCVFGGVKESRSLAPFIFTHSLLRFASKRIVYCCIIIFFYKYKREREEFTLWHYCDFFLIFSYDMVCSCRIERTRFVEVMRSE